MYTQGRLHHAPIPALIVLRYQAGQRAADAQPPRHWGWVHTASRLITCARIELIVLVSSILLTYL